jgi:biotin carboxyl carrier protein
MPVRGWRIGPGAMIGAVLFFAGCLSRQAEKMREKEAKAAAAEPSHLAEQGGEVGITLDSAMVHRIGLVTAPLAGTIRVDETEIPALVAADPAGVSFVRAGVAGRLAVGEGQRWPGFGSRVTEGEVVGVVGDARPLTAPRRGLVSRVLAQPGELVQAGPELLELTDDQATLVRVAWGPELPAAPPALSFATGDGGARVRGTLVGPAPEADPVTRNPAWLYRIGGGWRGMRPGAAATAYLSSPRGARRGLVVPARAVVQWDALAWAYVQRAPGRYVRVRVSTDAPVPDGWLVTAGFEQGDRVVIAGAGQLLSEEFRARIVVGEEVGE